MACIRPSLAMKALLRPSNSCTVQRSSRTVRSQASSVETLLANSSFGTKERTAL